MASSSRTRARKGKDNVGYANGHVDGLMNGHVSGKSARAAYKDRRSKSPGLKAFSVFTR